MPTLAVTPATPAKVTNPEATNTEAAKPQAAFNWADPNRINADLHCHSIASDGTLTSEALAAEAAAQGVQLWSLTDHDEVAGQQAAQQAAQALGLLYVPGVEVSVTWAKSTVHIVGLHVSFDHNAPLAMGLAGVRAGRVERAQDMANLLAKSGIHGAFEGAMRFAGNPSLIGRTHFARFLVETGVCTDVRQVFERYLVPGKPGYVRHEWATLGQAVSWIRSSGGQAVLAHPGRYDLKTLRLHAMLDEFIDLGGEGIEVVTGSHSAAEYQSFAKMSLAKGLKASRGSDFHGFEESRVKLGQLPPLPDGCVPIWDNWESRF